MGASVETYNTPRKLLTGKDKDAAMVYSIEGDENDYEENGR